ncbi:unnamed protein product [Brassica napus]|uniref:(rape) hypothetical protein n=1 Tax=Brassica napus TaxID=3708 RepID=A0A816Q8D1_BRANA|nr:unnamed protein product [Brassica napus]
MLKKNHDYKNYPFQQKDTNLLVNRSHLRVWIRHLRNPPRSDLVHSTRHDSERG